MRRLIASDHGPLLYRIVEGKKEPQSFTLADIKAHIGLSTNVSDEKRAAWAKRVVVPYIEAEMRRAE